MSEDMERRLGVIEGNMKVIDTKLDGITASVDKLSNGLGQRVQDHGEAISAIQTNIVNHTSYIDAVSEKVDKTTKICKEELNEHIHSPGHWKFLAVLISSVSLLLGIVGFVVKLAGGRH